MSCSSKIRRKERKLKKYAAELCLSGELSEKMDETAIKKDIRAKRKRELIPKIYFNADGDYRRSVNIGELQNLLISSVLNSQSPAKPKFCQIIPWRAVSQTIFVVVDCESLNFSQEKNIFDDEFTFFRRIPFVSNNLLHRFYVDLEDENFYQRFFRVPISLLDRLKLSQNAEKIDKNVSKCGKSSYLMTLSDMAEDNYPLPDDKNYSRTDFVYSLNQYTSVNDQSPVYAVDCEMCMTGPNRRELTRISVVDETYNVVLDTLVKPKNRITDYLTRYSGVTEKMLRNIVTSLEDVQSFLRQTLPSNGILCGHSLNFDLDSLKLYHPYTIDVSVLYNLSGQRKCRSSLKTLSNLFLGEKIQNSSKGHCSVEDAYATMKLFKLKYEKGIDFGNVQMGWDYNHFVATNNSVEQREECTTILSNCSKKRKLGNREVEDARTTKISKITESIETPILSCSCGNNLQANCRNNACVCRSLLRKICFDCLSSPNDLQRDDEDTCKIACEKIFCLPSSLGSELLFDLFERKKKKLLWLHCPNEQEICKLADASYFCRRFDVVNNDQCLELYKSHQLENDFNVLELNLTDQDYHHFDLIAEKILQYSARKSLVCFMFKQKGKGICCLKIKL